MKKLPLVHYKINCKAVTKIGQMQGRYMIYETIGCTEKFLKQFEMPPSNGYIFINWYWQLDQPVEYISIKGTFDPEILKND